MPTLCAELHGSGWSASVQRWRGTPDPPLSSNLGVATLAPLDRHGSVEWVAVRLMAEERFWISVTAWRGVEVSGVTADGRALEDELLINPPADPVVHRFARIIGQADDGIGREHVPVFHDIETAGLSVAVTIGDLVRLHFCVIEAPTFDAHFGSFANSDAQPAVYGGWRLP